MTDSMEEMARKVFENPIHYYLKYGPSKGHDDAVVERNPMTNRSAGGVIA